MALHERERELPELLVSQRRADPAIPDLRRPRYPRRAADPEPFGAERLLQRRHRLTQELARDFRWLRRARQRGGPRAELLRQRVAPALGAAAALTRRAPRP